MRTSKVNTILTATLMLVFVLSACGGGQTAAQPTEETAMEATSVPTVAPTAGPAVVEPGDGVKIILHDLLEGVMLDAKMDPDFKSNVPPSKNFDRVYTDTVIITITQNGEPVVLDEGAVELCISFVEPTTDSPQPKIYYWDTSKSPLVDGKGTRFLTNTKTKICSVVLESGAYAVVSY